MYKFSAVKYADKIAKVEILRVSNRKEIWRNLWRREVCSEEEEEGRRTLWVVDVTDLVTLVAIWPRRSGWGLGFADLLEPKVGSLWQGRYVEADDEGSPITKRWFGLVRITWEPGALEREGWLGERFGPSECREEGEYGGYLFVGVPQEDLEELKQKLAGTWSSRECRSKAERGEV